MTLPLRFQRVKSMTLTSAEIPFCMNTFSRFYKNNYFHITPSAGPHTGTTMRVLIQDGQYSAAEAAALITSTLAVLLIPVTVAVAEPSQRLVFTSATDFVLDFGLREEATVSLSAGTADVDQTSLQLKAGWTLGFRLAMYEGSNTYLTEGWFEPQTPRYLYLVVDDFNQGGNDYVIGALNNSILRDSILSKIALGPEYQGGMVVAQGFQLRPFHKRHYVAGGVSIEKLRIRLLDEYGRVIDLCNMDYSITLQFEVIP